MCIVLLGSVPLAPGKLSVWARCYLTALWPPSLGWLCWACFPALPVRRRKEAMPLVVHGPGDKAGYASTYLPPATGGNDRRVPPQSLPAASAGGCIVAKTLRVQGKCSCSSCWGRLIVPPNSVAHAAPRARQGVMHHACSGCRGARLIVAPNGVAYASPEARQGVLPRLLAEILATRIMVKAAMKRAPRTAKAGRRPDFLPCFTRLLLFWLPQPCTNESSTLVNDLHAPQSLQRRARPFLLQNRIRFMTRVVITRLAVCAQVLQRILNARQFGLKLIANVTYGYTAAGFSGRMPCAELADSIVQARRALQSPAAPPLCWLPWHKLKVGC